MDKLYTRLYPNFFNNFCAFLLLPPELQYTTIFLFLSGILFSISFFISYSGIKIAPSICPSRYSCGLLTSMMIVFSF